MRRMHAKVTLPTGLTRLLLPRQTGPSLGSARSYSAHVLGESPSAVKTIADLRAWPTVNGAEHQVEVSGWVKNVRKGSSVRFIDISDGSSMRPVQAVVNRALPGAMEMRLGAAVRVRGTWCCHGSAGEDKLTGAEALDDRKQNPKDPEFTVREIVVLGDSDPGSYPIQKKYMSSETLRQTPHFRMRTPLNTNLLRLRSEAMVALSNFFAEEQFQQTHPPIITSSDCEGAGETFNVNSGTRDNPFYQKPMYLTVSSQLHLEALAQALGNVWTLSPTFRAERSDTSRHLSEFYMLEAELSFVEDMDDILDFVQKMLRVLAQRLSSGRPYRELIAARQSSQDSLEKRTLEELDGFEEVQRRWRGILDPQKWPRITYTDAVEMLQSHSAEFESPAVWGDGLRSEHERFLAKKLGFDKNLNAYRPVFVTRYPRDIKAFYMLQADQGAGGRRLVDCFDLLVPDLGELAGGSMREHRLSHLLENMDDLGFDKHGKDSMKWYLDLRKWGCPPHGGFGVGFDRLLSYLTGVKSVRDIVPFPRVFGREDF